MKTKSLDLNERETQEWWISVKMQTSREIHPYIAMCRTRTTKPESECNERRSEENGWRFTWRWIEEENQREWWWWFWDPILIAVAIFSLSLSRVHRHSWELRLHFSLYRSNHSLIKLSLLKQLQQLVGCLVPEKPPNQATYHMNYEWFIFFPNIIIIKYY